MLRDCEHQLVGRRVDELTRAALMGTGATILISHLGLERRVQAQLGERLGLNEARPSQQSAAMVDAISDLLSRLKRSEPAGDERFNGQQPPFISRPCYADFAAAERVNSRCASIERARSARLSFLANSAVEWNMAGTELPPADKHLLYWKPVTFPAWT